MTRYALLSDVHGNLPALTAVLDAIAGETSVDATYHLGDLVGYAPWPNEVVALLHDRGVQGIAGNYDSTVGFGYKHCGCRSENPAQEALAHQSFEWTREHATDETKRVLRSLPFRLDLRPLGGHVSKPTLTLLHGDRVLNTVYVTRDRPDVFLQRIGDGVGAKPGDVIAVGHTHIPWHREVAGVHYINTGSVGRPKDGDWRAGYVILEMTGDAVTANFRRVEYSVAEAQEGIRASALPDEFADFLATAGS